MNPKSKKIIFITGTDTGVGKTMMTAAMTVLLAKKDHDFYVCKPLESGVSCKITNGRLKRPDTDFLSVASLGRWTADQINFFHFPQPLAPSIAAQLNGQKINFNQLVKKILGCAKGHDITLIEGAGGLLVPIAGSKTNLDLIKALQAQVLIVSRLELGTINHTCLTYDRLIAEGVAICGIVLNQTQKIKTMASKTNPQILQKMGLPILGVMPYLSQKSPRELLQALPRRIKDFFK